MGFLGRLFGTDPDSKIEKAKRMIAMSEFHEARWILEDLEHPETQDLMARTMNGLIEANLEEGRARYSAADKEGAEEHLALAREFGATHDQLREARREGRASMPAPKPAAPKVEDVPAGDDPIWSLPPEDPRLRYALMMEAYPEALKERLLALGLGFAEAALLTENGKPEEAFEALQPYTAQDDVARFERARAAIAAGILPAAASDLLTFGDTVGHRAIGTNHTAVMLCQTLVRLGRAEEAVDRLQPLIEQSSVPSEQIMLAGAEAQILFLLGRDEEADVKTTKLLKDSSRDMNLVKLLSKVRNRRGQRLNAMQILEDGLNRCCSAPGKCGSQALDLEAVRMLMVMYLEDRIEPKRTKELGKDLETHRKRPVWDDAYIDALVARNAMDPSTDQRVGDLAKGLKPTDPRMAVLASSFPQMISADPA
jgi:tetratricopeptide (TPR) repeat protein